MVNWVYVVLGLLSISLVAAFSSWVVIEWVWKPWRLILACRKQGISGFPFIPFVGQLPQISKELKTLEEEPRHDWKALNSAQECVKKYGKVFYFTTGKTVRISIADPDLLKAVLATNADCYAKPSFINVLHILGDGLFASSGEGWARQRQLLNLSFTSKEIKKELDTITTTAQAAQEEWLLEINRKSGELDIYHNLLDLTLNVIKKLAFAASGENTSPLITGAFDRYLHNCRDLVFGPAAAIPGYRFMPTSTNREIVKDQKWLFGVVEELIQGRSRPYSSSASKQMDHKVVVDLLMSAAQGNASQDLSSQQLRDNGLTILLAGHHTTASLLTWTMYMLALHPHWQERAREEVAKVCGEGGMEWATMSHLKTISMILQETLRLFPPVPLIGRLCLRENTVGPYTIPQGVEIIIPTAVIHRDKDLWGEDADQFIPTRFANGINKACRHHLGYLPFGYGPRTCVGQVLAQTEARAVLVVILQTFSWRLGPGYRHCPDISLTLQPRFDIPIIMEKL